MSYKLIVVANLRSMYIITVNLSHWNKHVLKNVDFCALELGQLCQVLATDLGSIEIGGQIVFFSKIFQGIPHTTVVRSKI